MAKKVKRTITKQEHVDLMWKVDNEGFGYYLTSYGPDLDMICKLGFDKKEVQKAIYLITDIETAILEAAQFEDEMEDLV